MESGCRYSIVFGKIHEQAMNYEQIHHSDAKRMNCFSTNSGVCFFGFLHANSVVLVGNVVNKDIYILTSQLEFMMQYAIKIEEYSEHNINV